jgi:hypothetical protein
MSVIMLVPCLAAAQDNAPIAASAKAAVANMTFDTAATPDRTDASTSMMEFHRVSPTMQSLYVATALTQTLDAQSTFKALNAGAVESNSLVKPFASNRPAFMALKAGMAAAFIYAGHDLSKRHKVGAVIALGLINSVYTAIALNNYHVAHVMNARR